MDLVLFDLDHTLIAGDSDANWGRFIVKKGLVPADEHLAKNEAFYQDYQAGRLDMQAYLAFQLAPLAHTPRAQLDELHQEFMADVIRPLIYPAARKLVAQHRACGALLAIVTATNRFVTGPIAAEFGVEHLIATDIEEVEGQPTGRPLGEPCYQAGKIRKVAAWLASRAQNWDSFDNTWCYSDSHNDLPLLGQVDKPIATNPDAHLREHAQTHAWPILDFELSA